MATKDPRSPAAKAARMKLDEWRRRSLAAHHKWEMAHQAVDELWDALCSCAPNDTLQDERDAVCDALDAFLASAGVSEERGE